MSKAITKERMALLNEASEMFDETGCVPGIDGEQVPAERIVPDAKAYISETIDDPETPYDPEIWGTTGFALVLSWLAQKWLGVVNDNRANWRQAWELFPGDVAYIWHASLHATTVAESLANTGFDIRAQIVWSKNRFALSRGDYHWQHEPCWYAVRSGRKSHWQGARDQSTVWWIGPVGLEDSATVHGTQKPVEAMRRPIVNSSRRGDGVYDPFSGSGSTLIAAETMGRKCFAMEIDTVYCDLIVRRWEVFTGQTAGPYPNFVRP